MKKKFFIIILIIIICILIALGVIYMIYKNNEENNISNDRNDSSNISRTTNNNINYEHVNENTTVQEVIKNPAFEGFGEYIFPINNYTSYQNMKISNINSLLPYHSYINTDSTIEVINYMLDEVNNGEKIFYDIYSDEEKVEDSSKEDTGLFFFRGNPDAPFAIICAGGGFSYVGSIHEAYPHALELSKQGYNAFVIQYRTNSQEAVEDLARAISYIFENAENLNVSTDNYSLWGSSAGARMVAYIGTYGVEAFGGDSVSKPATIIMAYTGHTDYSEDDPSTFIVVGENDGIANPNTMERRANNLRSVGVEVEFRKYPNLGHGFGLGIGTSAEGWINDAIAFWQKMSH